MNMQTKTASNSAAHSLEVFMTDFRFPSADHPVSEAFCADHFAEVVSRKSELRTMCELKADAREGVEAVESFCLLANDDIALVRVGIRGGKRIIWNFGGGV